METIDKEGKAEGRKAVQDTIENSVQNSAQNPVPTKTDPKEALRKGREELDRLYGAPDFSLVSKAPRQEGSVVFYKRWWKALRAMYWFGKLMFLSAFIFGRMKDEKKRDRLLIKMSKPIFPILKMDVVVRDLDYARKVAEGKVENPKAVKEYQEETRRKSPRFVSPYVDYLALENLKGSLVVSNHVNWLDIFVIMATTPARFVAKKEIRNWFVVGKLVENLQNLFIDRNDRKNTDKFNEILGNFMKEGNSITFFPEAKTCSDGITCDPFKAALFQSALDAGAPLRICMVRYYDKEGRRTESAIYAGDMNIAQSFGLLAREPGMTLELTVYPPVPPEVLKTRDRFFWKDFAQNIVAPGTRDFSLLKEPSLEASLEEAERFQKILDKMMDESKDGAQAKLEAENCESGKAVYEESVKSPKDEKNRTEHPDNRGSSSGGISMSFVDDGKPAMNENRIDKVRSNG